MRSHVAILALAALLPAMAQQVDNQTRSLACSDRNRSSDEDRRDRTCEIRESTMAAAPRVTLDGLTNGGISVKGWSRADILVRAKIETWAPSATEAQQIARDVRIVAAGANVHAESPEVSSGKGWAVSYEMFVPHQTGLNLKAHNGGIKIYDVVGDIAFEAHNGGVGLARLGGQVRGKTTNGGLKIELSGTQWSGGELDVTTTNGGIAFQVPQSYSANFEAHTVNGRISVDLPHSVKSQARGELIATLGSGGRSIRARTTNGGVSVSNRL